MKGLSLLSSMMLQRSQSTVLKSLRTPCIGIERHLMTTTNYNSNSNSNNNNTTSLLLSSSLNHHQSKYNNMMFINNNNNNNNNNRLYTTAPNSNTGRKRDLVILNTIVGKLINQLMKHGKKDIAERILTDALLIIKKTEKGKNPYEVLLQAIENIKPWVELRSFRLGGNIHQVPIPLSEKRGLGLGIRYLVKPIRHGRHNGGAAKKLAQIVIETSKNQGEPIKQALQIQELAIKNRALTHFRW